MENKINIIALCGKAGAGKDTIMQMILNQNPNLHEIISYTTRPPREGERDGVNYHFISNTDFANKIVNGDMLEVSEFNDWFYGTALSSLNKEKINIGVFNPEGIDALQDDDRVHVEVVYIAAADKQRLLRQLNREENPDVKEIIRRYVADDFDFAEWDTPPYPSFYLNNNTQEDLEEVVNAVIGLASLMNFEDSLNNV